MNEAANAFSHFLGFILSLAGFTILLVVAIPQADPWKLVSATVYGLSALALYTSSTLYHLSTNPRRKLRLRFWDHCAIYVFIAGSYTPFLLVSIRGFRGWLVFAIVWGVALAGILLKIFVTHRATRISTAIYLLMGWAALLVAKPLWDALRPEGFLLLVAGGLAYSFGIFFFARDHRHYHHALWHLSVLVGSIFHFLAIAIYVMPG